MFKKIKKLDKWVNEKLSWIKWYNKMLIVGVSGVLAYLLKLLVLRINISLGFA